MPEIISIEIRRKGFVDISKNGWGLESGGIAKDAAEVIADLRAHCRANGIDATIEYFMLDEPGAEDELVVLINGVDISKTDA